MKRMIRFLLASLVAVATVAAMPVSLPAEETGDVLLFPFFLDNGQRGVFLAWSEDGLHFTPLNGDEPVMPPANWPNQNLTRDPSIVYHGGKFHAVWTSGWKGRFFGYTESTDLVHWLEPTKVQPFPALLPPEDQPRNVWAPEITWDPLHKDFVIFWSSTTERESRNGDGSSMDGKDGSLDHRIYVSRTADGKNFSEAKLFFDQKFCCIDAQMALDDRGGSDLAAARWVMVFKNEREVRLGGKNLRLTFAPADLSQPWSPASDPIVGPGSAIRPKELAEGPTLVRWNQQWFLYWDAFASGHYSLATSADLKTWTDRTAELRMPPHPRHGTVFRAPRSAVGWLKQTAAAPVGMLVHPLMAMMAGENEAVDGRPAPVVILKLDDVTRNGAKGSSPVSPRWQRCVDFLTQEHLAASLGILGYSLDRDAPAYFQWIKDLDKSGSFEFWNHGYEDKANPFNGPSLESQKTALEKTQRLAREKLGITLTAFGPHWGPTDANTDTALAEIPEIKVWLFGPPHPKGRQIVLGRIINLEQPTFIPNFEKVKADYDNKGRQQPYLVLQGHPNQWDDQRFGEFVKVCKYLQSQGCKFTTISQYVKSKGKKDR